VARFLLRRQLLFSPRTVARPLAARLRSQLACRPSLGWVVPNELENVGVDPCPQTLQAAPAERPGHRHPLSMQSHNLVFRIRIKDRSCRFVIMPRCFRTSTNRPSIRQTCSGGGFAQINVQRSVRRSKRDSTRFPALPRDAAGTLGGESFAEQDPVDAVDELH
jgi:hypothetical protein